MDKIPNPARISFHFLYTTYEAFFNVPFGGYSLLSRKNQEEARKR